MIDIPELTASELANFYSKIDKFDNESCWNWMGGKSGSGYGVFTVRKKLFGAHRISFFIANNIQPGTLNVCHICDNPSCCNPSHLFLGTHRDNAIDKTIKKRNNNPTGDNHWTRRLSHGHGESHWTKRMPEKIARGDKSGARLNPDKTPKGEKHGMSKMTVQNVLEIRRLFEFESKTMTEIARVFKIDRTTVSCIVLRKTWNHI